MCHHGDEAAFESWREQLEEDAEHEPDPGDEEPTFVNEERDVDVALLEADDD